MSAIEGHGNSSVNSCLFKAIKKLQYWLNMLQQITPNRENIFNIFKLVGNCNSGSGLYTITFHYSCKAVRIGLEKCGMCSG